VTDVYLSHRAREDLRAIVTLFVRRSASSAFVARFNKAHSTLATSPKHGRPRDDLALGLRSLTLLPFSYVVFYVVESDVVQIVRIVDGRRDLRTLFR
jgi:toxin ParE1/3/4